MTAYIADYEVSCGVSTGFGVIYPDNFRIKERIDCDTGIEAIIKAETKAYEYARKYFCNPETGRTSIRIKIYDGEKELDIKQELLRALPKEKHLFIEKFDFGDGTYNISQSWIERIMDLKA